MQYLRNIEIYDLPQENEPRLRTLSAFRFYLNTKLKYVNTKTYTYSYIIHLSVIINTYFLNVLSFRHINDGDNYV